MENNLLNFLTETEVAFRPSLNQDGMQFNLVSDKKETDSRESPCVNSIGDCVRVEDVNGLKFVFHVEDSAVCRPARSSHKALPFGSMFLACKKGDSITWRHCSPWMDKKNRYKVISVKDKLVTTKKGVFEIADFVDDFNKADYTESLYTFYVQVRNGKAVDFEVSYE